MSPSLRAIGAVPATAAAAVLALAVSLSAAGAAAAETPDPTSTTADPSDCQILCLPVLGEEPKPTENDRPRKAKEPAERTAPPLEPAPAAPAPAAPGIEPPATTGPGPAAVPAAPAPAGATPSGSAAPESTAPEPSTTPSASASTESNWTKPVTRPARPTQAAAVSRAGGPGPGGPDPLAITAGVLLVGAGGLAFAWWGRSRLRAH